MSLIKLDTSTLTDMQTWSVFELDDVAYPTGAATYRQDSQSIQGPWETAFNAAIARNTAIIVEKGTPRDFELAHSIGTDNAAGRPISHISHFYDREGVSNGNFKARVAAGEIVVSDYMSGRIHVESEPVLLVSDEPVRVRTQAFYMSDFLDLREVGNRVFITDTLFLTSVPWKEGEYYKYEDAGWLPPLEVSAEQVFRQMQALDIDQALVTRKYADLNKGTLDILTSLAEMPKLIDSIFNGLALVADMLKSVKKKEIAISASFARRVKRLEFEHKRNLQRISRIRTSLKPGKKLNFSTERIRMRESQRATQTFNRAMAQTSVELADALASIWMNFRYNIMPTSYLIDDLIDTNLFVRTFLIERTGYNKSMSLSAGGEEHSYTRNCRVMMRRKIQTTGSHLDSASANFAVTAWELVPLSFVVDWFINIGDLISHLSITTHSSEQGATWAQRNEISSSITNSDGQKVTITGYVYTRTVIDPQQACLDIKWDMNANRYTDSLALIWGGIRSNLGKNRPK